MEEGMERTELDFLRKICEACVEIRDILAKSKAEGHRYSLCMYAHCMYHIKR